MTDEIKIDYKEILLKLIGSLTLGDNMGDVYEDCEEALKLIGIEPPDLLLIEEIGDLGRWLGKEHGVTTLYNTDLYDE